ncbi:hypothetical protein PMAYCL1PPCAC_04633, partial [Pristionchus mayeri]
SLPSFAPVIGSNKGRLLRPPRLVGSPTHFVLSPINWPRRRGRGIRASSPSIDSPTRHWQQYCSCSCRSMLQRILRIFGRKKMKSLLLQRLRPQLLSV